MTPINDRTTVHITVIFTSIIIIINYTELLQLTKNSTIIIYTSSPILADIYNFLLIAYNKKTDYHYHNTNKEKQYDTKQTIK